MPNDDSKTDIQYFLKCLDAIGDQVTDLGQIVKEFQQQWGWEEWNLKYDTVWIIYFVEQGYSFIFHMDWYIFEF